MADVQEMAAQEEVVGVVVQGPLVEQQLPTSEASVVTEEYQT